MIIAGAGGHARELLDILDEHTKTDLFFFDNLTKDLPEHLQGIPVIRDVVRAKEILQKDPYFIPGTGNPVVRQKLFALFTELGGVPFTCKAASAIVSTQETQIGIGCNLMQGVFISCHVTIGKGTLVNTRAHLHHDVVTGDFCEIGPGALLLGGVQVGNHVQIGAGAILLPGITVANDAVVGAGAVVTKDVGAGKTVKGNPAV